MKKEGTEINEVLSMDNAHITVSDGKIESFGKMEELPTEGEGYDEVIDAGGGFVMPSFCDSHTHIVYAGCRDGEFRDKIDGLSYEEIAARGGGILNSADLLHRTSEDELYRQSAERAREVMLMGTGSLEIKSGYGLTVEDELKMLRVIRRLKEDFPMEIRSTFLGAHAVGRAFAGRQADYVDRVAFDLSVNYERMLGRRIPKADLAHWLVCAALDGGVTPGANEIQVVLIHSKEKKQLDNFLPASFSQELDGKGFDDPHLGTFSISSLQVENLVSASEFFAQAFETLADAKEVKNLIVVPDPEASVYDLMAIMDHVEGEKNVTLLTMEPLNSKRFKNDILGYSLTSALGVRGDEGEDVIMV